MTALFITVLNMSITASIVALAVMLIRLPLKKAPKIFSYLLWGVVLFRLACPFSIESAFSLMPMPTNMISQDIVYWQNPAAPAGIRFIDRYAFATVNNASLPAIPESSAATNAGNELPISPKNSLTPIYTFFKIGGYVWLIGFLALLSYAAIGYIRLKRRVYYATLVRDNIFETDIIEMPFVLGFIHPKIYVPLGIDPLEHDYILQHEQTHIRRYDYLIKPFAFIIFALHWFNPLMWLAYFLMAKDIEMSCDEAVLRKADQDIRSVYSSSLLNLSVKRGALLAPLAFGESPLKDRVKNVLNFKKPSWLSIVVMIVFVTIFSLGFTVNKANSAPSIISPDSIGKMIEQNLEIIMSEPPYFSNSLDHICAHKAEYDEIVALGSAALQYMLPISDNGLKGAIMTAVCLGIYNDLPESELLLYFLSSSEHVPDLELKYMTYTDLELRYVTYTKGENDYSAQKNEYCLKVLTGAYYWRYLGADGITEAVIKADSLHPLDSVEHMDIITKPAGMDTIILKFAIPPKSYSVRRWSDAYIGNSEACKQAFEPVKVYNNVIFVAADKGYIYEVSAIWPQGSAHYSFYIK
ncbi:MAG: M56 family metallopeptidase [Clostridiales bacterium]|jgi:beta-lactamase regulating signal transducer with metallopeptidase domain|nr:M56 family metallopeptidase [Clostridiales bacterium]